MKAVAVPYVIALVLGIIVIGLVGYWFVAQSGKTVGAGTKAECQSKVFSYCLVWQNGGKNNKPDIPDFFDIEECISEQLSLVIDENAFKKCKELGIEIK